MIPIHIKLKKQYVGRLPESMVQKKWTKGFFVSTVTMADNVGYAVIQTEYNEFDLVRFYCIEPIKTQTLKGGDAT